MKYQSSALFLGTATLLLCATPASAMGAKFSWAGIPACSGTSPAFSISGVPKGTVSLNFMMMDYNKPDYNHGGSTIAYKGGPVPRGAISYTGPCPPAGAVHRYIWTIKALDESGKVLATAKAEGRFPAGK